MFESLSHLVTILGLLTAFWMGYRASKKEDKVFTERIPNLDIINTEEESEAPKLDDEIRKDMEHARTLSGGYDFENN